MPENTLLLTDLTNLLLGQVYLVIIGYSVILSIAFKGNNQFTLLPTLAFSYLTGTGIVTFLMSIMSLINLRFEINSLYLFMFAFFILQLFILVVIFKIEGKSYRDLAFIKLSMEANKDSFIKQLFYILILVKILAVVLLVISKSISVVMQEWDALSWYSLFAVHFFQEGKIEYLPWMMHNTYYPLNRTFSELYVYLCLGKISDGLSTSIFGLFYVSIVISVYYLLKESGVSKYISIVVTLFVANDIMIKAYTMYQNSDLMCSAYTSVGCMLMFVYLRDIRKIGCLYISSILIGFSIWTRPEYTLIIPLFLSVFLFYYLFINKINIYKASIFFIFPTFMSIFWSIAGNLIFTNFKSQLRTGPHLIDIYGYIDGIYAVIVHLVKFEFFNINRWQLNWIMILACIFWTLFDKKVRSKNIVCVFIIVLHIFFITFFAIYYRFYTIPLNVLHTNTHRTLLHILPFALFFIGITFNSVKDRILKLN